MPWTQKERFSFTLEAKVWMLGVSADLGPGARPHGGEGGELQVEERVSVLGGIPTSKSGPYCRRDLSATGVA